LIQIKRIIARKRRDRAIDVYQGAAECLNYPDVAKPQAPR